MKKCCQMLAKYFGVMAVVFLVLGLVTPTSWLWILGKVQGVSVLSVLLGIIMFGMGTTLDLKDFLVIFRRPRDIFLGALAQYTIAAIPHSSFIDNPNSSAVAAVVFSVWPSFRFVRPSTTTTSFSVSPFFTM